MRSGTSEISLRHGLRPGDQGMIVHLHGVIYAAEYGLDTTFEPYVSRPLADFALAGPHAGRVWLAERKSERWRSEIVGSIAIVKSEPGADAGREAQLRWFVLRPETRGHGLGRRMLQAALDYCREERIQRVFLWTFADLDAAIHIYRAQGFHETASETHDIWGARRTELRFELQLAPPP